MPNNIHGLHDSELSYSERSEYISVQGFRNYIGYVLHAFFVMGCFLRVIDVEINIF